MTILSCSQWEAKGKYVIVLEDDMKETENESQFDIMQNRLDLWIEKGVKFKVVVDPKLEANLNAKNNKLSTKIVTWLHEHKVERSVLSATPKATSDLAINMRTLVELIDDETRAAWVAGKTNVKNLSTKTWADVQAEVKEAIDKYSTKKNPAMGLWLDNLKRAIDESPIQYPFIAADMKRKDSQKVVDMYKKVCSTDSGKNFAYHVIALDLYICALSVVEGLSAAIKSDDRVFFFTGIPLRNMDVVGKLLGLHLNFTQNHSSDPDADESVSDKELSAVMDGFVVKKASTAAKKKKKGKKKGGEKKEGDKKPAADKPAAAAGEQKAVAEAPKAEVKA